MFYEIEGKFIVYNFSIGDKPVIRVDPGSYILFHTQDAHSGTIESSKLWADVDYPELDETTANPVTGPVFINGAKPGMTLKVSILQVLPEKIGFLPVRSYMGLIRNVVDERLARVVKYENDLVWISEDLYVPARPMVGTIGVAPASGKIQTAMPGPHGGNLDNNLITTGADVYLPIRTEGALLCIGDIHAAMGDGELTCGGVDICARVLVKVELIEKSLPCKNPVVIKDRMIVTHGFSESYEKSSEMACKEMVNVICSKMGVTEYEAVLLMASRADVGLCQACRCSVPMVVRVAFPIIWHGNKIWG